VRTVALAWSTPRAWARMALAEPLALLADHAWCELGAASSAQGLVARYPDLVPLAEQLIPLAAEELRHFRRVERLLRARGGKLEAARRNPYAEGLLAHLERGPRPGSGSDRRPLERLLVSALIEARSLERFSLLAEEAEDASIAALFAELATAEAAHASLFLELAHELFPAPEVDARLELWVEREARLIRGFPPGPRIHSGFFEVLAPLPRSDAAEDVEPVLELRPREPAERTTEVPL
jgi:tRNA-(ms[2]io[6]A)-hydroxylase